MGEVIRRMRNASIAFEQHVLGSQQFNGGSVKCGLQGNSRPVTVKLTCVTQRLAGKQAQECVTQFEDLPKGARNLVWRVYCDTVVAHNVGTKT